MNGYKRLRGFFVHHIHEFIFLLVNIANYSNSFEKFSLTPLESKIITDYQNMLDTIDDYNLYIKKESKN